METGKMFQMKMRVKGGTGKPDEIRENKVKGGDNDVLYCYDKSDERC